MTSQSEDMIERVADGITRGEIGSRLVLELTNAEIRSIARAAIDAMQTMVEAGQPGSLTSTDGISKYSTTRDIVIPAGTILDAAPWRVIRGKQPGSGQSDHLDAIIAHGKDASSTWTIAVDDALSTGLVEPRTVPERINR